MTAAQRRHLRAAAPAAALRHHRRIARRPICQRFRMLTPIRARLRSRVVLMISIRTCLMCMSFRRRSRRRKR